MSRFTSTETSAATAGAMSDAVTQNALTAAGAAGLAGAGVMSVAVTATILPAQTAVLLGASTLALIGGKRMADGKPVIPSFGRGTDATDPTPAAADAAA